MATLRINKESPVKHGGHYDRKSLAGALRAVGIERGDIVFTHVGLGMLGYPQEGPAMETACAQLWDVFRDAIGEGGSLFVPTYSYSYCKNEIYDSLKTPSDVGGFTNYFLGYPNVKRSLDPIFSVAGIGPHVNDILTDLPHDCFGHDCIYARLLRFGAKICNIGVGFRYATFIHHVEQMFNVPYRFRKLFFGQTVYGKELKDEIWIYNVRILDSTGYPDLRELEKEARKQGLIKASRVGLGEVTCIKCSDMWSLCTENIEKDPWFLAAGPAIEVKENNRGYGSGLKPFPTNAIIDELSAIKDLRRDLVSEGCDATLEILAKFLSFNVHFYPTGTECFSWIVPERWGCQKAYLEKSSGEKVLSIEKNPYCVASYSKSFDGRISQGELLKHLWIHPNSLSATPVKFIYYDLDWGLCCDQATARTLTDPYYHVFIESTFGYGSLKIGESVIPGQQKDCIILCVPFCDRSWAYDGLVSMLTGIEVFSKLRLMEGLKYSYHLLLVPVDFSIVAYLSQKPEFINSLMGIIFLQKLDLSPVFVLKTTSNDSAFNRDCKAAFIDYNSGGRITDFKFDLEYFGNRKFNLADLPIPTPIISLESPNLNSGEGDSRSPSHGSDFKRVKSTKSVELVMQMIKILESKE